MSTQVFRDTLNSEHQEYFDKLSSIQKVLYKSEYEFAIKYIPDATACVAHQHGEMKIANVEKLVEEERKPKKYVNLKTGKTFICTEEELIRKHS